MTIVIPLKKNLLNTLHLRILTSISILSTGQLRYEVVMLIGQRCGPSVRILLILILSLCGFLFFSMIADSQGNH